MNLSDAKKAALIALGYSSIDVPTMENQWLQDLTGTTGPTPWLYKLWLEGEGYSGPVQWMFHLYLGDEGYTGSFPKRLLDFWLAGGASVGVPAVWNSANKQNTILAIGDTRAGKNTTAAVEAAVTGTVAKSDTDVFAVEFDIFEVGDLPANGRTYCGFQVGTTLVPALANRILLRSNGSFHILGSTPFATGYDTADIITFIYDGTFNGGSLWVGINGSWVRGGDPSIPTAGLDTGLAASISGSIYAGWFTDNAAAQPAITMNAGQSAFTYVPAGYPGMLG